MAATPFRTCFFRVPSVKTPISVHLRKPYLIPFTSVYSKTSKISAAIPKAPTSRSASYEPQKGVDVLLASLERAGVDTVFASRGDSSMEIHQALTRFATIGNVLFHHERGSILAAGAYARVSGRPGVCIASSGPGANNLVTGLVYADLDGVPVVAITCQVPLDMMEVTKLITKRNYLVQDAEDIPRIVNEALILATTGRPGPVHINISKCLLQKKVIAEWGRPMKLHGYLSSLSKTPELHQLEQILCLLDESKKPILFVRGGCLNLSSELRRLVELTGILLLAFGVIHLLEKKSLTLDLMYPLSFNSFGDAIHPVYAIQVLDNLMNSDAIITTGVGEHQISVVKGYNVSQLLTFGCLGAMGFGLPAAIGAAKAMPGSIVVDIDGDESFNMNIQELATVAAECLPVKIMIVNNQHLGTGNHLKFAEGCNIPTARVTKKSELVGAIKKMLETPGPYLLDVIVRAP